MYQADDSRYDKMSYKRCGNSGILLPRVSLGMWQNFGTEKPLTEQKEIIFRAFDLGITHFDLANNYGAPNIGMAEENFGKIFEEDLKLYREQILVSTKAGYDFWPGPYGNWGSRKYLMSSLDASLKRMKLDYVDISIIIVQIRRRRWKRPWAHCRIWCGRARRCMWEFPIIRQKKQSGLLQF